MTLPYKTHSSGTHQAPIRPHRVIQLPTPPNGQREPNTENSVNAG